MRIVQSTGCFKSLLAAYFGIPYFPWGNMELEWWPLRGTSTQRIVGSGCQISSIHMPFGESAWRRDDLPQLVTLARRDLRRPSPKSMMHLGLMGIIAVGNFWHRVWKPGWWPELDSELIARDLKVLEPEALLFHGDQVWDASETTETTETILMLAQSIDIKIHVEYCSIGPSGEALTIQQTIDLCREMGWKIAPDLHHSPEFEEHLLALKEEGLLGGIQCRGLKEAQRVAASYPSLKDIPIVIEPKDPTT